MADEVERAGTKDISEEAKNTRDGPKSPRE